jgi:signal transduction histidine kinase
MRPSSDFIDNGKQSMQPMMKQRFFWWLAVPALTAVLIALGILQYRWSSQVSAATRSQMQSNLESSMIGFRQDLARELSAVCLELRSAADDAGSVRVAEFSRQFQHWQQTAAHPGLVTQLYLWRPASDATLFHVDTTRAELEAGGWPAGWEGLRQRLGEMTMVERRHSESAVKAYEIFRHDQKGTVVERAGHPDGGTPHVHSRRGLAAKFGPDAPFLPWFIDESIPALVYPLRVRTSSPGSVGAEGKHSSQSGAGAPASASAQGNAGIHENYARKAVVTWIIVRLDPNTLHKEIFPELAQKYFRGSSGFDYHVAVLNGGKDGVLYSSDAGFAQNANSVHDASLPLFGPPFRRSPSSPPGPREVFAFARVVGSARALEGQDGHNLGFDHLLPIAPIHYFSDAGTWELVARHKSGSLEAAVASLRQRQLLLSFGVLLLLAVTMAMVLAASQRARRLAALQMGFVAGVSHELRTPLAVISSAAENIAHGVVADPAQVSRYGASILKQARQLTHLVEQVLLFASTQQKTGNYPLRPVHVDEAIDAALENTASLAKAAGIAVERRVEPGLPPAAADFAALSQCLQNLITNAIKYGSEGRWLGIAASPQRENGAIAGIDLTVSDKGPGIAASEIKHIFEPFYRSPSVAGSNVHGTGLGLPLARTIVEAMRGTLTVASEPGRGSVFTIHLTIAAAPSAPEAEVASGSLPQPNSAAGYTP